MKVFSTLSPKLRSNLLILFVAGLLFWCSLGSLLGTLPALLSACSPLLSSPYSLGREYFGMRRTRLSASASGCAAEARVLRDALYIQHVGGSPGQVGMVIGSFSIGLLLSRRRMGQMADKRSRKIVLLIGIWVVAIAPLGYLLRQSIPVLMAKCRFSRLLSSPHALRRACFGMRGLSP